MSRVSDDVRRLIHLADRRPIDEGKKDERTYDAVVFAFADKGSAEKAIARMRGALEKGDEHAEANVDYSGEVLSASDPMLKSVKGTANLQGQFFAYFRASPEAERALRLSIENDPQIRLVKQDPKSALVASKTQAPANVTESKVTALKANPVAFLKALSKDERVRLRKAVEEAAKSDPKHETAARKLLTGPLKVA